MSRSWSRYYDAVGAEPRETLLRALALFDADGTAPGTAVDLGSGTGRDTLVLLARGWTVVAIDAEEEAMERLAALAPASDRLTMHVARYEDAEWPECDLVNSSFALPFMPHEGFADVWPRIVASLRSGGRFCGQLFGDRDAWAGSDGMTFHSRRGAEELFLAFDLEQFDEIEEAGKTAIGEPKQWHFFNVVARKR